MFEGLFSDSVAKLRIVANITFVLYVIAGGIMGYSFASANDTFISFPIGIVVGFGMGWLNTLMMHVFANIAENIVAIGKMIYKISENYPENHEN